MHTLQGDIYARPLIFHILWSCKAANQWRSQNGIVARAQVGHIYNAAQHAKVSVRKHALLGGLGACPPGKFWNLGPPRSHLLCFQAE